MLNLACKVAANTRLFLDAGKALAGEIQTELTPKKFASLKNG